jgi:hypothetical protein
MVMTNMRCAICGEPWGTCDCWIRCHCGWYYEKGTKCGNPEHSKPPRDVECPYCHAGIGEPCIQRNGIKQAWPHKAREKMSRKLEASND